MALPKINETLNFSMTIPSTGEKVKYRPYLVKEEKILLQAHESGDQEACLSAMSDTISACLDQKAGIDVASLATFDLEYMYTQLRAKSVGETSSILIKCKSCEEHNEYVVDLEKLEVVVPPKSNSVVQVTESISVEMRYPTYGSMINGDISEATTDMNSAMNLIASSIVAVLQPDERTDASDVPQKEIMEFLGSMTGSQLALLTEFLGTMPALKHEAKFNCKKCGTENELQLKGLSDFF
jgi:DNA-directed RNA polymerase subunit M/transcription elongation factor TFIIS